MRRPMMPRPESQSTFFGSSTNPPKDVIPSSQGVDVSTTVTGLQPGRRYPLHLSRRASMATGGVSGCYIREGYRAAYTAPKAPLYLSVDWARGGEISLSWAGGNTLDRDTKRAP